MGLYYDYTKIKDVDTLCWTEPDEKGDRTVKPLTWTLTLLTMAVGMGDITEKNYGEFYARLHLLETLSGGGYLLERNGPDDEWRNRLFTLEDIRKHIGLHTNVGPETRAQFIKRHVIPFLDEATEKWKDL